MLISDEIQNLSDAVMLSHECVIMCSYNSQLYSFRNVDSVLIIENVVF